MKDKSEIELKSQKTSTPNHKLVESRLFGNDRSFSEPISQIGNIRQEISFIELFSNRHIVFSVNLPFPQISKFVN